MATNPRSTISERTDLTIVGRDRTNRQKQPKRMMPRILTTLVALALLAAVLRYLPPGSRNVSAQAEPVSVAMFTDDLQLGSLQMSVAPDGEALYLDGVVKNTETISVTGATVEVDFHNAQGKVVSTVQKPIMGMSHGGTDLIQNEFRRNPIQPNETRFFRIAMDQVPPAWNHELPELKIVTVTAQ